MPFFEERPRLQNLTHLAEPDRPESIDPTLMETFGAAFRTQNVVGSYLSSRGAPNPYEIEDGFDAIDYVKDDPKYAPYVEEFSGIFNRKAADAKKMQIQREEQDRLTLDAAGGMGYVAQMAAGVVDLPTLLPVGGVLAGGTRASMMAGTALGAGLDAALSEGALQATQATRTVAESVLNIGGSIVLGGALGLLAGTLLPSTAMAMSRKVERQEKEFQDIDRAFARASSAGAAAKDTGPLVLKDEGFISKLPIINQQDPLIRLQLGSLDSGRQTVRQLAETPLEYKDNAKGIATERGGSVETRMKMWNAPLAKSLREIDTNYARYFNATPEPSSWQRRLAPAMSEFDRWRGGQKMTYKQFKEEVGRAAYMGGKHEIPEVAAAAKAYRQLDEELKQAAIDAKLFPEDIDVAGDISHRFRMYNKERIIAERGEFSRVLQDYFVTQRDLAAKLDTVAAKAGDTAAAAKAAKEAEFGKLSDAELKSIVDDVIDTILGHADGRIPYDIVAGPRGALKERVLKIETAKIHKFTENDIEQVMRSQIRTMSADVELAKKFGDVDLKEEIRKVNDEANARIASATNAAERKSLEKARKDTVRDIEGIRDRLRGTYKLPSDPSSLVLRAGRIARNINYVRLLGGMTISAVPDMAKVVFTHGLTSTFRDGFIPMVRNFKAFRLAGEEVKSAGTALDMVLDSRTMAMADIVDEFGHHSKFERGLSALSSKFGVVSLMAPWNAAMKQFSGLVTMTNILKAAERVAAGKGTQKDITRLAASGIDENLAQRIWKEFAGGEETVTVALPKQQGIKAFHGSPQTNLTSILSNPPSRQFDNGTSALGAFLAPNAGGAKRYAGDSGKVYEAEVNIQNPYEMPVSEFLRLQDPTTAADGTKLAGEQWGARLEELKVEGAALRERLAAAGHDGVFIRNSKGELMEIASFNDVPLQAAAPLQTTRTIKTAGHGEIQDGVYLAHAAKWKDKGAMEAFRAAVVRDVDRIIVTPGQDKPLWMSTELGKTVGQFKSFAVSSMQRTMLAGIQQRDAATLNGLMLMMGLGAVTYALKEKVSGREPSDDPAVWAAEAFDRSGISGWLMEANNIAEKATRGRVGLSAVTGQQISRYGSRNVFGAFFGPTPDAIADIFQVSGSIFAGDTTKSDLRKARQLLPAQNLFYIRELLNQVEAATGDALGLPDTRKN